MTTTITEPVEREQKVGFTTQESLWQRVKQRAKKERRHLSQQATVLLEKGLEAAEAEDRKEACHGHA